MIQLFYLNILGYSIFLPDITLLALGIRFKSRLEKGEEKPNKKYVSRRGKNLAMKDQRLASIEQSKSK